MRLKGKKVLITGGGRGIGKAIAVGMANEGCDVVLNYVKNENAAKEVIGVIEKLGRKAFAIQADMSRLSDVEQLVRQAEEKLGQIDILVNNAGIAFIEPFLDITEHTWDVTLQTNLKGAFFCSQFVARQMIASNIKGAIVNVSSTNGTVAEADCAHYNASKGGLEMVTKSLAIELAPYGIRVNAIAPGIIETEIDKQYTDPAFRKHYFGHIPMRRFGRAEECVGAVILFSSDESSYITGQSLLIDGGLLCEQCPKLPGQ
jgi:NAD(P)-dependent dehydrogenase (short-subunit alcohol dehydrogenase family)